MNNRVNVKNNQQYINNSLQEICLSKMSKREKFLTIRYVFEKIENENVKVELNVDEYNVNQENKDMHKALEIIVDNFINNKVSVFKGVCDIYINENQLASIITKLIKLTNTYKKIYLYEKGNRNDKRIKI